LQAIGTLVFDGRDDLRVVRQGKRNRQSFADRTEPVPPSIGYRLQAGSCLNHA